MRRVADALRDARAAGVDRLDAQLLLARRLQRPRSWLLAHDDAELPDALASGFDDDCRRRASGEPLAYLIDEREFHGLSLVVSPAVLVPRPETEGLVDWALELLDGPLVGLARPAVADLGTGSGAIAIAVAHGCARASVCATDISAEALEVARGNARQHGITIEYLHGDWWQPLAGRQLDLVLSNPPYIADGDPHLEALAHEPLTALTPGGDGLGALRCIVDGAGRHLRPGGWLLLEHGHDQGDAVRGLLVDAGFASVSTRADLAGLPRCSGGRQGLGQAISHDRIEG